ncbi:MAG: sigma factor G inhibitor Gin [Limnochordia bacterium]
MECLICRGAVQREDLEFCGVIICEHCEGKMMHLSAEEPEYEAFVSALRGMWQRRFQASRDRRLKDGDQL